MSDIYSIIDNSRSNNTDDLDIIFDDGYESESDDKQFRDLDTMFTQAELDSARDEILAEAKQQAIFEQNRLEEKRRLRLIAEETKQLPSSSSSSESNIELESSVSFPISEEFSESNIYSESEIILMRNHKYYKLANLLSNQFYLIINYYQMLIFAFKHEATIDNNMTMFILTEILTSKLGPIDKAARDRLINCVNQTVYPRSFNRKILTAKFPVIQKLAKKDNPVGYDEWKKEQKSICRRVRMSPIIDKESHPIYQFICSLTQSDYGRITPTNLHNQYVAWRGDANKIETIRAFGLFLSKFGIPKKRYSTGFVYMISVKSIETFINSYNA